MKRGLVFTLLLSLAVAGGIWLFHSEQTEGIENRLVESQAAVKRLPASGPLRVSPVNSRYFVDASGHTVYLTGSHNWNNLQDADPLFLNNDAGRLIDPGNVTYPKFDFSEHLRFLIRYNHNFTRLWTCEEAAWVPWLVRKQTIEPLPFARTGPGEALDGKPKFNLTQLNQEYFDRLYSRVKQAGDSGIYVSVMLFNGWSVETKGMPPMTKVWRGHPFNRDNNINGVDGDPNKDDEGTEAHTLQVAKVTAVQEAYVRKTVTTLNDLDNVLWEISNESNILSTEWQYHMIKFIKECEATLPKQHPVGMTFCHPGGTNEALFDSPADWISPSNRDPETPSVGDGRKVIILDSDHLPYLRRGRAWVWKSFTDGLNPIFMDPVEMGRWESVRQAMGMTLAYAKRMNLAAATPHGELSSSGFCLANPGEEYLVYVPLGIARLESLRFVRRLAIPIRNIRRLFDTTVTVDLSSHPDQFRVEWLNPFNGEIQLGDSVKGGRKLTFTAPFRGDAVLYLVKES
ncbi:MAG TPA: hypothetical protein VFQ78_11015 [Candidatus Udaeobacter sp.]|nr:hypothetical protein [Candidatus Udaeobacter sp.]